MDILLARPAAAALLVVLIWGLNVVFMKIGLGDIDPVLYTGLRFTLLALVLIPFCRIPRAQLRPIVTIALVMGIGHFCMLSIGISYVDSVVAGLIILLGAPLSSLLAFVFLSERLRTSQMLAVLAAALGAIVPTLLQDEVNIRAGALIMLFSMLMWAAGNLQVRKLKKVPVLTLQFWIAVISAPICLVIYQLDPEARPIVDQLTTASVLSLLYVVGFSSVLGYALWYKLISRHGINSVVNYVLLQPLITMVAGYWLLAELMTVPQLAGGGVTLLAMWAFYRLAERRQGAQVVSEDS